MTVETSSGRKDCLSAIFQVPVHFARWKHVSILLRSRGPFARQRVRLSESPYSKVQSAGASSEETERRRLALAPAVVLLALALFVIS